MIIREFEKLRWKKTEMKYPALRVPPGGNQVDGLPPAFSYAIFGRRPTKLWQTTRIYFLWKNKEIFSQFKYLEV